MVSFFFVVPEAGLEPARGCPRQILRFFRKLSFVIHSIKAAFYLPF